MIKIAVGVSSCLLGEHVRYDGGHRRDSYIVGTLGKVFELVLFCPEVAIGLGVPRPMLKLIRSNIGLQCVGADDGSLNVTDRLRAYANEQKPAHSGLSGYIFKKGSPSCGVEKVRVVINGAPDGFGTGIYADQLRINFPLMPMEEEGRLGNLEIRENFLQRVRIFHRWKALEKTELSRKNLTEFHNQHKLIVMSHDQDECRKLGRLLTANRKVNIGNIAQEYVELLMRVLKKIATRENHVKVLQHLLSYLNTVLSKEDKVELSDTIDGYLNEELPLIAPITLLKHHFRKNPDPYVEQSFYMSPYPDTE